MHEEKKVVSLEDRIPKIKQNRKQKSNRRLISFLSLFFILILLVIYFQSPLSKVSHVDVTGNDMVSKEEILSMSGITSSTGYWNVKEENVKEQVTKHKKIKDLQIEKRLPGTIIIKVEEYARVAYAEKNNAYFPFLENGNILDAVPDTIPADAPILVNWKSGEEIRDMASELMKLPDSIANSISEIHHTPTESDPWRITLFMNDGFEVSASVRNFAEKMLLYPSIASQLNPDVKGVIHLEVGTYFKAYNGETEELEGENSSNENEE